MALDTGSEINSRHDNTVKGFIGFEDYTKSDFVWPETTARNWTEKMENYDSPGLWKNFRETHESEMQKLSESNGTKLQFLQRKYTDLDSPSAISILSTKAVNEAKIVTSKVIVIERKCN